MFKWHVDAAISRSSRGRVSDLTTVADGIAFSLRQFSLSAAHSAEDQPSRKTRSATAFAELASSTPRPSRSSSSTPTALAAKPSTFTARRIVVQGSASPQQRAPRIVTAPRKPDAERGSLDARGSARGRGGFMGGARGRGIGRNMEFFPRGGAGGGGRGSRGRGARGRGDGGRGRGRGRGRGLLSGPRKPKKKPWEEEAEEPFTEEETDYLDRRDGGFTTPYIPDTSLENLARHRPPVISSATGFADFVRYKLAVTTDNVSPLYRFSSQHLMRVDRGYGTLFEDLDQRSIVQEHKDKLDEERAAARGEPYVREEFGQLAADKRKDIMLQWVAGHYEAPSKITSGDPLSYVRNYAKRNETWLSQDAQRFEAKVASFGLRK